MLVSGALALIGVAAAHPVSRDNWSLRTALRLNGESLDAMVVLEVPFDVVMAGLKAGLDASGELPGSPAARGLLDGWNEVVFRDLAEGLVLTVDGRPAEGSWVRSDNRHNARGAVTEGFFLYIVEFKPAAPLVLGPAVEVGVTDTAYVDRPMAYSAVVMGGEGWVVQGHSAQGVLPDRAYDLSDPAFWVSDPSLRLLSARWTRKVSAP